MTLHNLAYHGWTPNAALPQLGLRPGDGAPGQNAEGIDLIAAGIEAAEIVNTVSPGYAREALTPAFGMGLDGLLRSRGDRFIGILNGLDTTVWDPATDRDLAATYRRGDLSGKTVCRADLLTRVGFAPDDDGPVIGMIGRLDPQKGFDLLAEATPALLARGARLIVQGSGHPSLADPFRALAEASPGRVALIERFDRVDGPADLRRGGLLCDALALRAVRAGADDRAALRDATDRAPDGRAGGHRDRCDGAPRRRDGVRVRRRDAGSLGGRL